MNHPWQQPIRPLEVHPDINKTGTWYPVLFIRPRSNGDGWEAMSIGGRFYFSSDSMLRIAD